MTSILYMQETMSRQTQTACPCTIYKEKSRSPTASLIPPSPQRGHHPSTHQPINRHPRQTYTHTHMRKGGMKLLFPKAKQKSGGYHKMQMQEECKCKIAEKNAKDKTQPMIATARADPKSSHLSVCWSEVLMSKHWPRGGKPRRTSRGFVVATVPRH